ncbi:MAG TPA: phage integrase N-terminal domain-containing protein [Ideonella sp.]|uniref:phage integrase N-terminal domain-containing protein n=1 Tax=Ideonella sp. TaxID=1929293 RepID=UPI002E36EB08|nr:phage integrase N-terminal domain-containing protein [Ideonella sp.]HEX5685703.1 phage integrase N-terminal domain-containing protein [Ideonella sp.]
MRLALQRGNARRGPRGLVLYDREAALRAVTWKHAATLEVGRRVNGSTSADHATWRMTWSPSLRHHPVALTQAADLIKEGCMPARVHDHESSNHLRRDANAARRAMPRTPEEVLAFLPHGTSDWRSVLAALLKLHNGKHSTKDKGVSFKTMADRQRFYFGFFAELRRETRFKIDPRQLRGKHVEAMVERWVERGLSTATIHNYLSFLRTFAEWLGKCGMVREPAFYVGSESPHAHRHQIATVDQSWSTHGVDIEATIQKVAQVDSWVGLQLELCHRFGLRPKEARHFRPHEAERTRAQALPADAEAHPECDTFVRLLQGTKGGRLRDVPVTTDEQRELLARLKRLVPPGGYVGRANKTALQNQHRFYYVVRRLGISKKVMGVVAHGLRHQLANDLFEEHAGVASPVRGGDVPTEAMASTRYRVSRLLGHARERAAAFYIGSRRNVSAAKKKGDDDDGGNDQGGAPCSPA